MFPTIDPDNPYQLTKERRKYRRKINLLRFKTSERLQKQISYLYNKGVMRMVF